jgi:hypothetical protein
MRTIHVQDKKETSSYSELSRKAVIERLNDGLPCIYQFEGDKVLNKSKYVKLAIEYKYENYRLLRYKDIDRLGLTNSISYFHKRFIVDSGGAVLIIFNSLNKKPVSCVFRSLQSKDFVDYSYVRSLYGFDMIQDNFKYGDILYLTEGYYDADVLRTLNVNSVAMLTSNVNQIQANILKSMTNRFVVAFDQDNAGEAGYKKAIQRLGKDIWKLPIYTDDKDIGNMEEYNKDTDEYKARKEYYTEQINKINRGYTREWLM